MNSRERFLPVPPMRPASPPRRRRMMDVTPGTDSLALTTMPTATPTPRRSARSELMVRWWSRSALVAIVFVLGLLQGTRAALGDIRLDPASPEPAAELKAETPPAEVEEPAALRGRFFRPDGSSAVRPALRLAPSAWSPEPAERIALACPGASC